MNIFALDPSPIISANYHCDQHLHKMILESAQLLSTAMYLSDQAREFPSGILYVPAYPKHPCTKWVAASPANMLWLIDLATELENIRDGLNCPRHSSSNVIDAIRSYLHETYPDTTKLTAQPRIFAGPAIINIRPWNVEEKYRKYYRQKHNTWTLDKGAGMSYKGRPVPDFMSDLVVPS